jgi:hypothetical protein
VLSPRTFKRSSRGATSLTTRDYTAAAGKIPS